MGIQVICPGCMRRFEVSDRFAGKKGPCPKCGHIIEIPKENVIVHAPDEIIVEGRKVKNPDFVRPIEREPYAFTRGQLIFNGVLAVVVLSFACLFSFLGSGPMKWLAAALGIFVVACPMAKYGYIMVRNPDDLEIFLGRELYKKAFFVALGYTLCWFLFELTLLYLNPGFFFFLYLIPIAILASFVPLVVFDTDFGDSLMLFMLYVLLIILLRGLMFSPDGWIWQTIDNRYLREIPLPAVVEASDTSAPKVPSAIPVRPKLDPKAPNPSEALKK